MLSLLDDPDESIVAAVEQRLYEEGQDVLVELENRWESNAIPGQSEKIEQIISNIQERALIADFKKWLHSDERDLLQASLLIARIQYPGMDQAMVHMYLEKVRLDVWMALYAAVNPLDKVQVLNHILFERQGLKGNITEYHAPDNSFIHRAIESRQANPITLCVLYTIIAQKLGLPVFGVNLPQHFVLAYCDDRGVEAQQNFNNNHSVNRKDFGPVLFYINPFSGGQIFLKKNIDEFLEIIKVEPQKEFYEPCDNLEIMKRMLRNLHFSYGDMGNQSKKNQVESYMHVMGMFSDLDSNNDKFE